MPCPGTVRFVHATACGYESTEKMKLFPARAPLKCMAIEIFGEFMETPRRNKYLLVITDRFSNLVRTVPISSITIEAVAKAIITLSVMSYGSPVWLPSENIPQLIARFLQFVCGIREVKTLSSQCTTSSLTAKPSDSIAPS